MPLIQNLDLNKAHSHDMLSIRMLKLCGRSICKSFDLIFQSYMKHGEFPTEWEKANVVSVHKKVANRSLKIIDLHVFTFNLWKNL